MMVLPVDTRETGAQKAVMCIFLKLLAGNSVVMLSCSQERSPVMMLTVIWKLRLQAMSTRPSRS